MKKFALMTGLVVAGMVMKPGAAVAQGSVAGTWLTEFDIGIRIENGVETSMGKRQGRMTLKLNGDEITGTWQVLPEPNAKADPSVALKGKRVGNKVTLQAEPVDRAVNLNGEEHKVKLTNSYDLELKGDLLEGSATTSFSEEGMEPRKRSFSAKRVAP